MARKNLQDLALDAFSATVGFDILEDEDDRKGAVEAFDESIHFCQIMERGMALQRMPERLLDNRGDKRLKRYVQGLQRDEEFSKRYLGRIRDMERKLKGVRSEVERGEEIPTRTVVEISSYFYALSSALTSYSPNYQF